MAWSGCQEAPARRDPTRQDARASNRPPSAVSVKYGWLREMRRDPLASHRHSRRHRGRASASPCPSDRIQANRSEHFPSPLATISWSRGPPPGGYRVRRAAFSSAPRRAGQRVRDGAMRPASYHMPREAQCPTPRVACRRWQCGPAASALLRQLPGGAPVRVPPRPGTRASAGPAPIVAVPTKGGGSGKRSAQVTPCSAAKPSPWGTAPGCLTVEGTARGVSASRGTGYCSSRPAALACGSAAIVARGSPPGFAPPHRFRALQRARSSPPGEPAVTHADGGSADKTSGERTRRLPDACRVAPSGAAPPPPGHGN